MMLNYDSQMGMVLADLATCGFDYRVYLRRLQARPETGPGTKPVVLVASLVDNPELIAYEPELRIGLAGLAVLEACGFDQAGFTTMLRQAGIEEQCLGLVANVAAGDTFEWLCGQIAESLMPPKVQKLAGIRAQFGEILADVLISQFGLANLAAETLSRALSLAMQRSGLNLEEQRSVRDISNTLEIGTYIHCGLCLQEKPPGISPADWKDLEVGWTRLGLQVRCRRHQCNVVHIDFQGIQHPANSTRPAKRAARPKQSRRN